MPKIRARRLTLGQSHWLYVEAFPAMPVSLSTIERQLVRDELEAWLFHNDGTAFDWYEYADDDTVEKALRRLKRAYGKLKKMPKDKRQKLHGRSQRGPQIAIRNRTARADGTLVRMPAMTARRLARGLTQRELAERIGCSSGHVSGMECGHSSITESNAARIARALNCAISELSGYAKVRIDGETYSFRKEGR